MSFGLFTRIARAAVVPALLLGMAQSAKAGPITLSFSGTVSTGWDSSNLFGGGNLTGNLFTGSITFDPDAIGRNSCGTSTSTTSCNWSASGGTSFTQTLTMIDGGQSYTQEFANAATSSLSVSSSGNDAMYLSFGGSGFSFSLNAVATGRDDFFANQANVNDLANLYFDEVALNRGLSAEYGSAGGTSFTLKFDTLSASSAGGSDPGSGGGTEIPEPATLAIFAAALLGLAFTRRRFSENRIFAATHRSLQRA